MSNVADRIAGSSELALRRHGMDGQRLLNMAYAVAHGYCRRTGSGLDVRIDDLAQHLAQLVCRRALMYDTALNPNSSFASWAWDIMDPNGCIDWFRKKAEGHGDRRYGHDGRIVLAGDDIAQLAAKEDPETTELTYVLPAVLAFWRGLSRRIEPRVSEKRLRAWNQAANAAGLPLDQFMVRAADVYAQAMEQRAA